MASHSWQSPRLLLETFMAELGLGWAQVGVTLKDKQPGKPVAYNNRLLSMNYKLLCVIVAYFLGYLALQEGLLRHHNDVEAVNGGPLRRTIVNKGPLSGSVLA